MIAGKMHLLITFHTTAGAMAMEKRCRAAGLAGRLIPVPREITADCGLAWRGEPGGRPRREEVYAGLETAGVYAAAENRWFSAAALCFFPAGLIPLPSYPIIIV